MQLQLTLMRSLLISMEHTISMPPKCSWNELIIFLESVYNHVTQNIKMVTLFLVSDIVFMFIIAFMLKMVTYSLILKAFSSSFNFFILSRS